MNSGSSLNGGNSMGTSAGAQETWWFRVLGSGDARHPAVR
jgi:hypothetical protein